MHIHAKFQDFPSLSSKVSVLTEGQTDRQMDQTETITLPSKVGGNEPFVITSQTGTGCIVL